MGRGLSANSTQIIQDAYINLVVEQPSGVRRVAYALYGNSADDEVKRLGKLLGMARKRGFIPWEWITDDTRPSRRPYVVQDASELRAMKQACPDYDPWPAQGARVVIWSEKSLGGTLQPVLDRYLVEFQVHHGNTSLTEIRNTAEWTRTHRERLVILYVGDHDPKGLRISEDDIPKRMQELGARNWMIQRVAILQHDAEAVDRGSRDAFKPGDKDIGWYCAATVLSYGVEVETLPSNVLRDRVEAAIVSYIADVDAWNRTIHASEVVRESWAAHVAAWPIPPLGSEYSEGGDRA